MICRTGRATEEAWLLKCVREDSAVEAGAGGIAVVTDWACLRRLGRLILTPDLGQESGPMLTDRRPRWCGEVGVVGEDRVRRGVEDITSIEALRAARQIRVGHLRRRTLPIVVHDAVMVLPDFRESARLLKERTIDVSSSRQKASIDTSD